MTKRGRKSAAEILTPIRPLTDRHQPAPADMTPAQIRIWEHIVSSEPPGWFATGAHQDLLRLYCEHASSRADLQTLIDDCSAEAIACENTGAAFLRMLTVRDRETKLLASLARQMRLTHQSRYTPQAAGTAERNNPTGGRPWENNGAYISNGTSHDP
ncbi:hypothetical protein [Maricaulis sp.]|uniref:hypothetical protein n=1 Tax=Maricaulis sp. TaxID=1486257 RepID=UPI003A91539F